MRITVTRAEFAAIVVRGLGLKPESDVAACILAGIITGRSDATIAAKANVTRAELTIMLQQLLQQSNLI